MRCITCKRRKKKDRRRTELTDRTLNLSDLYELLHDTLLITEEVKEVLRRDCDEAAFVLKPWQVKTVIEKRADESICNCKKIANENEAEEIAAGVGRAIILAQELREKLKLNVASKRKPLRKDTIEDIYLSNSVTDRKRVSRNDVTMQKANIAKSSDRKESSALQSDKVTSLATRRSALPKSVGTKQNNVTDKLQSKVPLMKVAGKTKREKNFILENKLNVRKISSANKLQVGGSDPNDTSQNSRKSLPPEASAAELSELIRKMARRSTENALIPPPDGNNIDCPLHGDNTRGFVQERIVTIDVVEALRHFNVPNEMLKVLRTYRTFLKTETSDLQHSSQSDSKESKHGRSIDVFLKEFEAMNAAAQDRLLQERHLLDVTVESMSTFSKTFSGDLNPVQFDDVRNALAKLGTSLKRYNIENIVKPVIERPVIFPLCNLFLPRGWMSNGIWNTSCMKHFKNFSKVYNIRYRNKKQLLSLYEAIQKLQRTEYLNTLIRIISRDVIPAVRSNVDPTSVEYARAYKAMFILRQGLNPEVPVLVRTDG